MLLLIVLNAPSERQEAMADMATFSVDQCGQIRYKTPMKLAAYLKCVETSPVQFAEQIGVDRTTVYRWLRGARVPNRDTLERIRMETKGRVTANDFLCDVDADDQRECAA